MCDNGFNIIIYIYGTDGYISNKTHNTKPLVLKSNCDDTEITVERLKRYKATIISLISIKLI